MSLSILAQSSTSYAYENGAASAPLFDLIIIVAVIAFVVWVVRKGRRNNGPPDDGSVDRWADYE